MHQNEDNEEKIRALFREERGHRLAASTRFFLFGIAALVLFGLWQMLPF